MTWHPLRKVVAIPHQHLVAWPDRGVGIVPPAFPPKHSFSRDEISFSAARNMARSTIRPAVTRTLARNAANLLKALVDRNATGLTTLPDLDDLGDQALNAFAHDVAVGVAGLCMERAGFIWRAHAKEILPIAQRPDYIWSHAVAASGVVISEVKGMAGSSKSFADLIARVNKAFIEQVHPWQVGHTPAGTPICGGYAIGVRTSHSHPAQVAAVRSLPAPASPLLPSSRPLTGPISGYDPLIIRQHYASAVSLMGLGGMSRRIAGLPALESPSTRLAAIDVEGMRFVTRLQRGGGLVVGMAEEAFRYATDLERSSPERGSMERLLDPPPIYEARADVGEGQVRGFPHVRVQAPDGLSLIDQRGGVFVAKEGHWDPRGATI